MGLFSWLFGATSPEERVAAARAHLATGEYNEARIELEGLETPEAASAMAEALAGLVLLNLQEAVGKYNAGDPDGAKEHLELARQFGATPDQLREVRRVARELREQQTAAAEALQAAAAAAPITPEGDDPIWSLPPDDPRLRYAALIETYPEALRERFLRLGADFAEAVLSIDDGDGQRAYERLGAFPPVDPVARFERARAALSAGMFPAAASELRAFGDQVGHTTIGTVHTAVLLGDVLARLGRLEEALVVIEGAMASEPAELALSHSRARILEGMGRLDEAEAAATSLLRKAPRSMGVYRMLGGIRVRQGNRDGARATLEAGLTTCCSSPGKCGNQPLDLDAARMLARLYLEDRLDPERAGELLDQLQGAVREPVWEDAYLAALVARNRSDPRVDTLASRLIEGLDARDPRRVLVARVFAEA